MASTVETQAAARRIGGGPTRSVAAASWTALGALLLRDLVVLRKHLWEFVLRTLIQPFLLCFVFLYVFPKIGQGIGGRNPAEQSAFATILLPGVIGISVMFQGVQSIALAMAQEFGFTREIEDRGTGTLPDLAGGRREDALRRGPGHPVRGHRAADRLGRARARRAGRP